MSWSFRTNGNFIDFVHTDETSLQVENTIVSLHNTSKCIDWSLPEDTTRISFTIDEVKYSNIPIADVDFDGTPMDSQDDFETGIESMFPNLAGGSGGGSSYLVAEVELDNDEILTSPLIPVQVIPAPGANKVINIISATFSWNISNGAYDNIDSSATVFLAIGDNGGGWNIQCCSLSEIPNSTTNCISQVYGALVIDGPNIVSRINLFSRSSIENLPIVFAADNGLAGNLIDGNASNTLKIMVNYTIDNI